MNIIERVKDWAKKIAESGEEKKFLECVKHLKFYGEPEEKAFETARTIMMASFLASAAGWSRAEVFEELIHIYGLTLLSGKIREIEVVKLLSLYDIHKFNDTPREMGPDDLLKVFNLIIQENRYANLNPRQTLMVFPKQNAAKDWVKDHLGPRKK